MRLYQKYTPIEIYTNKKKVHMNIYVFPRGHGNESCNLIGSQRGPDFPISDHGHGNGRKQRGWNCHVQQVFVNELAVTVDLSPFYTSMED